MAQEAGYRTDGGPVDVFIASLADPLRREDAEATLDLYLEATGLQPKMWGPSIIGFGQSHFLYPNGTRSLIPAACFSPRKAYMALYLGADFEGASDLYARLGPHKSSAGGCIQVKRLPGVDSEILREIVQRSFMASLARAAV